MFALQATSELHVKIVPPDMNDRDMGRTSGPAYLENVANAMGIQLIVIKNTDIALIVNTIRRATNARDVSPVMKGMLVVALHTTVSLLPLAHPAIVITILQEDAIRSEDAWYVKTKILIFVLALRAQHRRISLWNV